MLEQEAKFSDEIEKTEETETIYDLPAIIKFSPFIRESKSIYNLPAKIAAKSSAEIKKFESRFYIYKEPEVILKINIKNGNQIYASVISESCYNFKDAIIFCLEIKKYFLPDSNNEYYIGVYENFNMNDFNFELLMPINKVSFVRNKNDYVIFIKEKGIEALYETERENLKVEIKSSQRIKTIVIKSGNQKDFIIYEGEKVYISKIMLKNKFELFIY